MAETRIFGSSSSPLEPFKASIPREGASIGSMNCRVCHGRLVDGFVATMERSVDVA